MARPRKNAAKAQGSLMKPDGVVEITIEEQPYPLPEGWKWVYLKNGYEVTSSKRIHKSDWRDSGIPFYRTRELVKLSNYGLVDNELFIDEEFYESIKLKFGVPQANDILISGVGTIGIPYIVSDRTKFYFKDGNIIWLKNKNIFLSKFVFYLFKSPFIKKQIHEMSAGTTVDTYTIVNANKTKLPLPPLKVQQRIVDRIESLFAKLDEAREKAEVVLDGFESRKAAILHKAFTGELTAKWREKKNISLESWGSCPLISVLKEKPRNGYSPKPVEYKTNVKSMTLSATTSGFFRPEFFKYIDEDISENSYLWLSQGDILIQRANSLEKVGTSAIYTGGDHEFIYPDLIMKLQVRAPHSYKYIAHILSTQPTLNYFRAKATGTAGNMPKINQQIVSNTPIVLPSCEEQNEITRILDSLLAKEQQVKEAAETVLEQITLMKKAILARVFRGELTGQVHN